jgi:hypothetical protein
MEHKSTLAGIDFHINAYYGHTDLFSALKVRFAKLEFSAVPFHYGPGFEIRAALARAPQSIFQN